MADEQQAPPAQVKGPIPESGIQGLLEISAGAFNAGEIGLIWDQAPYNTRPDDFARFVYVCAKQGLNPLLNDIHMEYRNSRDFGPKMTIVTHVDAYRRKGAERGDVDGTTAQHGVDVDLGFWVEVAIYLKGHTQPFTARAHYNEYVQMNSKGQITSIWTKRYMMTAKCAESLAWRKAGVLVGTVGEDELGASEPYFGETHVAKGAAPRDEFAVGEKPTPAAPAPVATQRQAPPAAPAPAPQAAPAPAANLFEAQRYSAAPPPPQAAPQAAPAPAQNPFAAPAQAPPPQAAPVASSAPAALAPTPDKQAKEMLTMKHNLVATLTGTGRIEMNKFYCGFFGVAAPSNLSRNVADFVIPTEKLHAWLSDPTNAELNKKAYNADPVASGAFLAGRGAFPVAAPSTATEISERFKWPPTLAQIAAELVKQWHPYTIDDLKNYVMQNGFQGNEHQELFSLFRVALRTRQAFLLCQIKQKQGTPIDKLVESLEGALLKKIEELDVAAIETTLERAAAMPPAVPSAA